MEPTTDQFLDQGIGAVQCDDLAGVHHRHAVAKLFGLFHVMGSQHDGAALGLPPRYGLPHQAPGLGIQAGGRLVQEYHGGVVDQGSGNGKALLLAAGERPERCGSPVPEVHRAQQGLRVNLGAVDAAEHLEQFLELQVLKKRAALQLYADQMLDGAGVFSDVNACDDGVPAIGGAHPFNDFDGGGFAGTIWTEQGENLALLHLERNAVDGLHVAVALPQLLHHDDGAVPVHRPVIIRRHHLVQTGRNYNTGRVDRTLNDTIARTMIPLKLSVRNFLCYRDDVPPLDLQGVHVACLCGANGHGKSALLDAMTWCLWGQARTGSRNHNSLIAYGETECRVELDFQAKAQTYRAIRRRRSAGQGRTELDLFVLDDGDQPRPITGNTLNETSSRIRSLVGMDYDTFVNSAFLLQGRSDEFTRKTPSERKEVLSSILGLDLYEFLLAAARGKRSEWQDSVTRTEGALMQSRAALDELTDPTAELAEIDRRLRALSQELNDAAVAVQSRRDALAELRRKQTELAVAENAVAQLRQNIQQEEFNLAAIRERIESAGELTGRAGQIEQGAKLLHDARAELNRLELVRREHGALQDQRASLITAINREQASLESEIGELERRIREDLEPAASLAERTAVKLSELAETERGLTNEQHAMDAQTEQISNLTADIAARTSDLERCVEEGRDLRAKQQEMSIARGPDAVCPLCRSPLSEDACTNIAGWYESEIAGKLRLHADLTDRVKGLNQQRETLAAQTEAQGRALLQRQRAAQQERGRLEQQRLQSEDAGELLASLRPRLSTMRATLDERKFAVEERQALEGVDAQIADLGYDDAKREAAYQWTQTLQHREGDKLALDAAAARLPHDEADLTRGEDRARRLRDDLEEAERRLADDRAALLELPDVEQAARNAEAVVSGLSRERDDLVARQGRLQGDAERMEAYRSEIARLERSHEDAQAEQGIYAELFGAFGRSGVPAMLIDSAVPHLENEANHLLGRMTDNRMAVKLETQRMNQGGNTTETLDILISDELGSRNYELFSGGEAFRINLALRIALSKVLSQRLGAPLPTLFIDEGFGTQDAAGRERIVDAIASIQDEFEKIIVITHLEDLKDLFPARIEVLKTEAGSQFWLS